MHYVGIEYQRNFLALIQRGQGGIPSPSSPIQCRGCGKVVNARVGDVWFKPYWSHNENLCTTCGPLIKDLVELFPSEDYDSSYGWKLWLQFINRVREEMKIPIVVYNFMV